MPSHDRTDTSPLVLLRQLSKTYQEGEHARRVFHDLDAVLQRSECVVLLGRSGSGKSTLLNLIAGIDRPTAGEVIVDGVSVTAMSETERTLFRRRYIGFVFQFFNLIPTLTVAENLYLPLELNGLDDDSGRALAHELLREVGLAERAASFPDRLSGGEQQRIAIARALVHRPRLLLADEPTGNLDRDTGHQVLELLTTMARSAGATLLIVSHSDEALAFADRGFRLQDGRLVPVPGGAG